MKEKISKSEASEEIEHFFLDIEKRSSEEVKKIKKLAASFNIKLGDRRKLFCKNCLAPYKEPSIKIKNGFVNVVCENCGSLNRWKFKDSLNFGIKKETEECC